MFKKRSHTADTGKSIATVSIYYYFIIYKHPMVDTIKKNLYPCKGFPPHITVRSTARFRQIAHSLSAAKTQLHWQRGNTTLTVESDVYRGVTLWLPMSETFYREPSLLRKTLLASPETESGSPARRSSLLGGD